MRSKEFVSESRSPYEPKVVYHLAEQAKASGVDLEQAEGPWRVDARTLSRPGRNSLHTIPVITNEHTAVMLDTMEHASDVAGLLNWCGVHELEVVPELTP